MDNPNSNNLQTNQNGQQLPVFTKNPKLKNLILILIVVLLFSGIGLTVFSYQQSIYRQKLYYETEAGLPIHKIKKIQGDDETVCIQVITSAKNPLTGQIQEFPTPCDIPEGWQVTSQ